MACIPASRPSCPGSISSVPLFSLEEEFWVLLKLINVGCLEESGQWLENVDPTHLVLASGKLVLQKSIGKSLAGPNSISNLSYFAKP